ncbi:hypothetical protein Cfor_04864 [Coptotermes formosanus]|uniref:Protein adenylyltransferase Fic n=1 Tax=Coptotermes formosanus TaxID=36987 RepID=A0A6L2PW84_COPFO|nr:hypothetical protein Cfor_04864 [Coptotermes formosanus]
MSAGWCIERGRAVKSLIINVSCCVWNSKDEMNRCTLFAIFLCVVVVAFTFLLEYFNAQGDNVKQHSVPRPQQKAFSPLPDDSQLHVPDEGTLGLVLRRTDVSKKPEKKNSVAESEALSSLYAALEMKKAGKHDKALKLFQHAAALAPKHPDILTHYGEFLEETQKDIVTADQLYFQALTYSPEHLGALMNRQRTSQIVEDMDRSNLRRIDDKRDTLSNIPDSSSSFCRAKKEAYFQHIYHTVGIEGNTMTLSQTRLIVETRMAVAGKSIMEHNEILGLDAAMKYINATLVNRLGAISVQDILEIHKRVMGFVDPLESGLFRRTQVYVGGHIPPGPHDITFLMKEFEKWLNSERVMHLHPIRYAALAHYKLVHIHPFTDGNGRTARLLMNTILMQAGFPPVIILKQDRLKYYEYLEIANEGDIRPFVRFIAECTERTLDLFLWATKEYMTEFPAIEQKEWDRRTIILDDESGNWDDE